MKNSLFLLSLILLLSTCRKDSITTDVVVPGETPEVPLMVQGSVAGHVYNLQEDAIEGATVILGGHSTTTDVEGYYSFIDIPINEKGESIQVLKTDYFTAFSSIIPTLNTLEFVDFGLAKKENTSTLDALSGGQTSLVNDGAIDFPSNSFTSNNANYTGDVLVCATAMEAANSNNFTAPAQFCTVDNDLLHSIGMVLLQCQTPLGEALDLAADATFDLSIPIAKGDVATLPAQIPVWYFDEMAHSWKNGGAATKVNATYQATVDKLTHWAAGWAQPTVVLTGKLENDRNESLAAYPFSLEWEDEFPASIALKANGAGHFRAKVPAAIPIGLRYQNVCKQSETTIEIGSLNVDTQHPPIIVDANFNTQITGRLEDCSGNPIGEGYIQVEGHHFVRTFKTSLDGSFDFSIGFCELFDLDITAYYPNGMQRSQKVEVPNTAVINLGTLQTCENLETYLILNIEDELIVEDNIEAHEMGGGPNGKTRIKNHPQGNNDLSVEIEFYAQSQGVHQGGEFHFENAENNAGFHIVTCDLNGGGGSDDCPEFDFEFTQFGQGNNGHVTGYFTGRAYAIDGGFAEVEISGEFRARKG